MKSRFTFEQLDTSDATTSNLIKITSSLITASILNETGLFDDNLLDRWGRGIGNTMYDMTPKYSGYTSVAALMYQYTEVVVNGKKVGDTVKLTREHFYPRQVAGVELVKWALQTDNFGMNMLPSVQEKISEYNCVHYVLPEENTRLRGHQKVGEFQTWERSYEDAGVDLVSWKRRTPVNKLFDIHPHLESKYKQLYY